MQGWHFSKEKDAPWGTQHPRGWPPTPRDAHPPNRMPTHPMRCPPTPWDAHPPPPPLGDPQGSLHEEKGVCRTSNWRTQGVGCFWVLKGFGSGGGHCVFVSYQPAVSMGSAREGGLHWGVTSPEDEAFPPPGQPWGTPDCGSSGVYRCSCVPPFPPKCMGM